MTKKRLAASSSGRMVESERYSYDKWESLFLPGLKQEEERNEVLSTPQNVSSHLLQSSLNAIRSIVGKLEKRKRVSA